jgi:hypothetical protein
MGKDRARQWNPIAGTEEDTNNDGIGSEGIAEVAVDAQAAR